MRAMSSPRNMRVVRRPWDIQLRRRDLLESMAATMGVLPAIAAADPRPSPSPAASGKDAFRHRGYLGWITDLASQPHADARWPSISIDGVLLDDYRRQFRLLSKLGYNEVVIWGFYVARDWPVALEQSISAQRLAALEKLIESAHDSKLHVYSGLGVYSWGFEEIIKAFPSLSGTNPQAMCGSNPEAWDWMQKVVDFVFRSLPIDGVSMQSADQGRCTCDGCRVFSDAEYHSRLNVRVSDYIHQRWPGKTAAVSGWGMKFGDPRDLAAWAQMGTKIDYLIDVEDTSRDIDPHYRQQLIRSLACDFGTLGGPQIEPPQHWKRDRWFLPTARRDAEHLLQVRKEGGNACEYYFHIVENPGDEFSFHTAGKVLADCRTPYQRHMQAAAEEIYRARPSVAQALVELFLRAEDAYLTYRPTLRSGSISLEPLVSDHSGPAIYLSEHLNRAQRAAYQADLESIRAGFQKLIADVPAKEKVNLILRCLDNALADIAALSPDFSPR